MIKRTRTISGDFSKSKRISIVNVVVNSFSCNAPLKMVDSVVFRHFLWQIVADEERERHQISGASKRQLHNIMNSGEKSCHW